jgi:hypothetical protein
VTRGDGEKCRRSDEARLIKAVAADVMAKKQPVAKHGGARKHGEQGDVVTLERGNKSTYLAARIKCDRPDIAEAVERGEYQSFRGARAGCARRND